MNANVAPGNAFESIRWRNVACELPDSDINVLIFAPGNDEPVWIGFYDSEHECWVSDGLVEYAGGEVKAWADLPAGVVP